MESKSQYNTKHRQEILDYLRSMSGQHVTAASISAHFKSLGSPIGTATIYRHLERLVAQGCVNKYILDNTSPACFEYITPNQNVSPNPCVHLKCERCEQLIHLNCHELQHLQSHLLQHHNFSLNPLRTVLYGLCDQCRSGQHTV